MNFLELVTICNCNKFNKMNNTEQINSILKGVCNFYIEKFAEKLPKVWIKRLNKLDYTNPYNISKYLFDLEEKDKYQGHYDIDNFVEDIFKYLGYDRIIIKYNKVDELDWENEWVTKTTLCSYISGKNAKGDGMNYSDSELTFLKLYGVNHDPIEYLKFIVHTILAYDVDKTFSEMIKIN